MTSSSSIHLVWMIFIILLIVSQDILCKPCANAWWKWSGHHILVHNWYNWQFAWKRAQGTFLWVRTLRGHVASRGKVKLVLLQITYLMWLHMLTLKVLAKVNIILVFFIMCYSVKWKSELSLSEQVFIQDTETCCIWLLHPPRSRNVTDKVLQW